MHRLLTPALSFLMLFLLIFETRSQEINPFFEEVVSQVSYDTVLSHLQKFESLGIKEPGTAALDETAEWLIDKYQSFGYSNIVKDAFNYGGYPLFNIIITKMGTLFPPRYLIICGHYDTYQGPGVNDNGSGVASILEVARLLSEVQTTYSIKFIHFSAEEVGLIGSNHYVDHTLIPGNMNILLVFNIDEVGGVAGMINNTITCERDESPPSFNDVISAAFTDTLVNLTQLYSTLNTEISYAYGSDYVPFQEAGKIITGFYESNESPFVHSPNDLLARMSPPYVTQVAKAATAAALHFAQGSRLSTSDGTGQDKSVVLLYPNPSAGFVYWQPGVTSENYDLQILDGSGRVISRKDYSSLDPCTADISQISPGVLIFRFTFHHSGVVKTLKLLKI